MIDVAIIGAPGYAGVELTRLVASHDHMRLAVLTSASHAGRRVGDLYPALGGHVDLVYVEPDIETIVSSASVAFLAVPHTAAMEMAPALVASGMTVVDASADYRLKDPEVYERWYGVAHTSPDLLPHAVYGLPELDRTGLPGATLIACPGCYPTATLLAAMPALEAGVIDAGRVLVDAKSGISGAGKTPSATTHYCNVNESVAPYGVTTHRHTPEIAQGLSLIAGMQVNVVFTPHVVPMSRGLLSTVYLDLTTDLTVADVLTIYTERYAEEPFVTVHAAGRMPATAEVRGTNRAHIGIAVDTASRTLVVACAIDNLVKGTAGQAVQCANIALGLPESVGLDVPGMGV